MEIRCHIEDGEFQVKLERLLDSLSKLYMLDTDKFLEVYDKIPGPIYQEILRISKGKEINEYDETDLEDLADYVDEVFMWAITETRKRDRLKKASRKRYRSFTLRNPEDLEMFEEFLDRMIKLKNLSPGHFVELLPQCPIAYWDKIDDLRETSYKLQRDSDEYLRCLEKCKIISFSYSEYADMSIKINQDEEH